MDTYLAYDQRQHNIYPRTACLRRGYRRMHCGDTSQTIFGGRIGKRERNCSSSFQVRPQMLRDSGIDVTKGTEESLGMRQCHVQRTISLG